MSKTKCTKEFYKSYPFIFKRSCTILQINLYKYSYFYKPSCKTKHCCSYCIENIIKSFGKYEDS